MCTFTIAFNMIIQKSKRVSRGYKRDKIDAATITEAIQSIKTRDTISCFVTKIVVNTRLECGLFSVYVSFIQGSYSTETGLSLVEHYNNSLVPYNWFALMT